MIEEYSREPKIPSGLLIGRVTDRSVLEKADSTGFSEQIDPSTNKLIDQVSKPFDQTVGKVFRKRTK